MASSKEEIAESLKDIFGILVENETVYFSRGMFPTHTHSLAYFSFEWPRRKACGHTCEWLASLGKPLDSWWRIALITFIDVERFILIVVGTIFRAGHPRSYEWRKETEQKQILISLFLGRGCKVGIWLEYSLPSRSHHDRLCLKMWARITPFPQVASIGDFYHGKGEEAPLSGWVWRSHTTSYVGEYTHLTLH